jgi:hypothetical protein
LQTEPANVKPVLLQYRPFGHAVAILKPVEEQYDPTGQTMGLAVEPGQYEPVGHWLVVDTPVPVGQ